MPDLVMVAASIGALRGSAIFLHGLGGDLYGTWRCGADPQMFWPSWLAEDIKGLAVWSVGYEAPISRWRGSTMHLTDRATNILARFLAEPQLREGPLILIGHSLGGLLIKQLLRTAESEARHRADAGDFLSRVEKIAFLGTPHTGSGLASLGDRLRILIRPSVATICLVRNDPNLRDLNLWYRDWTKDRHIAHLVLTETKALRVLGLVVEPDSADPGLAGARPVPIDGNHWTVCKPEARTSDTYVQVRAFIERRIERPKAPGEEKLDALSEGQRALMEQVALLQREKGIPRAALVSHLVRLGARADIAVEEIPKFLERFADDFRTVQAQLGQVTDGDPDLVATRKQAAGLLETGDLDGAKALLTTARARISKVRQERAREEASLLGDEGRIDRLELNYRTSAAKFSEAAALLSFEAEAAFHYLVEQGESLYLQGDEFGDNAALIEAIGIWRRAVEVRPRSVWPLDWAMTQNDLGNALLTLGDRESGTGRLEEAVAAYRAALQERTQERVPLDWAATQNSLGIALLRLGERESGTGRLEEAIAAYRAALQEQTRERVPLAWATTQNNLGNALTTLGRREIGTARLKEAETAFRAALREQTRERVPLAWAMTQNNLGNALLTLGERESGTGRLEEAVAAYRAALQERTQERVPLDWAATMNNLGNALRTLGERESGTGRLEEAVTACRAALQERTRERVPLAWAMTQNNLGNALRALGERESGTGRLEEAVAAYRAALHERTRERAPLAWANSTGDQGQALLTVAERQRNLQFAKQALSQLTAASEMLRDAGDASYVYHGRRLPEAQALVEQLSNEGRPT